MSRYTVITWTPERGVAHLRLEAADAEAARQLAALQGGDVLVVRPARGWLPGRGALPWTGLDRRGPRMDLRLFAEELHALLDAGLSLMEALNALARQEWTTEGSEGGRARTGSDRTVRVAALRQALREGLSFSQALRRQPDVFPPLFIALVAAGETSGGLPGALARFIDYRTRLDAVRERLTAALIYPAVLLAVGLGVALFLLVYVVPRFAQAYGQVGSALPPLSRALLAVGTTLGEPATLLGLGALALALAAGVLLRPQGGRILLARILASRPLAPLRRRLRQLSLARFYRTFGLLLEAGLPAPTALSLASELLDASAQAGAARAIGSVRAGIALSQALEQAGLAPAVAADLLRTGERSGSLADKLTRIADFYDRETARHAERALRLLEPLLTLGIGGFIALILVLLYLPIFELAGSLQ